MERWMPFFAFCIAVLPEQGAARLPTSSSCPDRSSSCARFSPALRIKPLSLPVEPMATPFQSLLAIPNMPSRPPVEDKGIRTLQAIRPMSVATFSNS